MGLFGKKKVTFCGVCDKQIKGIELYFNIKNTQTGEHLYSICSDCSRKIKMIVPEYPLSAEETKEKISKRLNAKGEVECRMQCNVCGHVFYYTDEDIRKNELNKMLAESNRKQAVVSSLAGTTIQASLDNAEADRRTKKVIDFSKCPMCNSADLSDVSEMPTEKAVVKTGDPSSADEILKFKGLLDAGVITQEEFDAKKKQLLGL